MLLESAKLRCEKKIRLFERSEFGLNAFSKFVDSWRNLTPKPQTILTICDWETF